MQHTEFRKWPCLLAALRWCQDAGEVAEMLHSYNKVVSSQTQLETAELLLGW